MVNKCIFIFINFAVFALQIHAASQ